MALEKAEANDNKEEAKGPPGVYEFEPDEETILEQLLPRNLAMQIYGAMLESAAKAVRMFRQFEFINGLRSLSIRLGLFGHGAPAYFTVTICAIAD